MGVDPLAETSHYPPTDVTTTPSTAPAAPDTAGEETATRAPAVVVVVVAHEPGAWFASTLASFGALEYSNLSVLVVDAGSSEPVEPLVHSVLPDALVHRLDDNPGFGAAANTALEVVAGASFYLFCHDDVRAEDGLVQLLVGEAFRSNAAIVGPKIVDWDEPRLLRSVGFTCDRSGAWVTTVDPGEIDQSQHDAVRDVFAVSDACILVRADLFEALGGFDPGIDYHGGDLDLCWRAQVAGARVVVAPSARVGHREALAQRRPELGRRRRQARHAIRTRRVAYRPFRRWTVAPGAALLAVAEVLYALITGHWGHAVDVVAAWGWAGTHRKGQRSRRRALQRIRQVTDRDVGRLQAPGSARLAAFARRHLDGGEDRLLAAARRRQELSDSLRSASLRTVVLVVAVLAFTVAVSLRGLLFGGVPAVGTLQPIPDDPGRLVAEYLSGWRSAGLGSDDPAPTAYGLLGLGGFAFLGAVGVLRSVLLIGMLPIGLAGMWHLLGPLGSRRARLVGLCTYAITPVAGNALANGHWAGLTLYGLAPWLLSVATKASGVAPFGPRGDDVEPGLPAARLHRLGRQTVALGLAAALAALFVPVAAGVGAAVALALIVGGLLVGSGAGLGRLLVAGVGSVVVAVLLHLPWALGLAETPDWLTTIGSWRPVDDAASAARLLRFESGPHGASPLGYGVAAAAFLAVLIGRGWRLSWAVRSWVLALVCWAPLWAAGQGWIDEGLPDPEVLLAPAAAALALAAAMGMAAFEADLSRYRFGWRQGASVVGGLALLGAVLPYLAGVADGSWGLPGRDFGAEVALLDQRAGPEPYRTVWIGAPGVLPLAAWPGEGGGAVAGSRAGLQIGVTERARPDATDVWLAPEAGATAELMAAVAAVLDGDTARAGRILAPMGVRYVIVADRSGPEPYVAEASDPLPLVTAAFERQLDLVEIDLNPALSVYENTVWGPARALLEPDVEFGSDPLAARDLPDYEGAPVALPRESGHARASGALDEPTTLALAAGFDPRWRLEVGGQRVPGEEVMGWATAFRVGGGVLDGGTSATLSYDTPAERSGLVAAQAVAWLLVLAFLARARARGARADRRFRDRQARASAGSGDEGPPGDRAGQAADRAEVAHRQADPRATGTDVDVVGVVVGHLAPESRRPEGAAEGGTDGTPVAGVAGDTSPDVGEEPS